MNVKYIVQLTAEERSYLEKLVSSGNGSARKIRRARILLKADSSEGGPHWSYEQISAAFDVHNETITNVRRDFSEGGLEWTLTRKPPDRDYPHRLDGHGEAFLMALACSAPPEGRGQWSLRLLRDRLVKLEIVDTISHETIRSVLKKKKSSPG